MNLRIDDYYTGRRQNIGHLLKKQRFKVMRDGAIITLGLAKHIKAKMLQAPAIDYFGSIN